MPPDAPPTRSLLVIEDGHEYEEFARLFLADGFAIRAAHSAAEALARLTEAPADAFLVDLRFERSPVEHLIGDVDATARRRFAGDHRIETHDPSLSSPLAVTPVAPPHGRRTGPGRRHRQQLTRD